MANSNTIQSVAVGEVRFTQGEVFAKSADGNMRRLAVGDQIFEGEVIVTASGSSAEINMFNGTALNVGEQQSVAVDSQVASPAHDATAGAVSDLGSTEAAKVVQTVSADDQQDFNVLLEEEAAAAGLTGGDGGGGSSFVDLVRIVENVPTTGYDFPINPTGTPPVIEGQVGVPPVVAETPIVVNLASVFGILPSGEVDGILEGGSVIFTVMLSRASGGDVTITLSNGAEITIPAGTLSGSSQPVAVQSDDPYVDPSGHSVSIVGITGGGANEVLSFDDTPVGYTVADTIDTTTVSLAATPSITEAGTSITYTATLTNAAGTGSPVTVTLSNGETITIAGGASSGSVVHAVTADEDVYIDPTTVSATISSATGGNFESLVVNPAAAVTSITDTINATTVTLTSDPVSLINWSTGQVVFTASVPEGAAPQSTPLVINLTIDGSTSIGTVTIPVGATTGSNPISLSAGNHPGPINVSILSATGGNYEALNTDDGTAIYILDTEPTLAFTNSIGSTGATDQIYTGLWNDTLSADIPHTLSVLLNSVTVGGSAATASSFDFDAATNIGTGTFTYTGGTVGFTLVLNNDGTYTLDLESSPTVITITPTEFLSAVRASGPTATYVLTYTDTATGTTQRATVTAAPVGQPLVLADATDTGGAITYAATTVGTDINASSDGIGIGNNVISSHVKAGTLTTERLTYNPEQVASAVTVFFKDSGNVGFGQSGSEDVLYFTMHGTNNETQTIMLDSRYGDFLVNQNGSLTAITSGSYTGGALNSYALDTPAGWDGIDNVEVTAGFYTTNQGIQTTDVKLSFGFSTETTVTVDQEVQMGFTATLTDYDGSSAVSSFTIQTDADHTFVGTGDADYIVGTSAADTITGGAGDDVMTGGSGADTFVFRLADIGTEANPATDTVKDFSISDALNLSEVLSGGGSVTFANESSTSADVHVNVGDGVSPEQIIHIEFEAALIDNQHLAIDPNNIIKITS